MRTAFFVMALSLVASGAHAQPYAPDMGYVHLKVLVAGEPTRTLAVGDGIADDTDAMEQAISACVTAGKQTVYAPAGMYKITRPLPWRRMIDGKWAGQCSVEGETRESTVFFLGPEAQGFSDPLLPNAVFITSSFGTNNQPQLPTTTTPKPGGVAGPLNSFRDFTIDTRSFPGAQGIDWVISNRGAIERIKIVGNGVAGIDAIRPYPGPGLIQDVEVVGFNHGIRVGNTQFNLVLRNVTVSGQKVSGIEAGGPAGMHVENLISINTVPGVRQTSGNNALALIGAKLMGGDPTKAAIETHQVGRFLLRDVEAMGYRTALKRGSVFGTGSTIAELSSHAALMAFPGEASTLRITPEREPDAFVPTDFARDCARPNSSPADGLDDRAAIQAALDSGKPCVYLPHSRPGLIQSQYFISGPLNVPATVQMVDFGNNFMTPIPSLYPSGQPAIVVAEPSCTPLTLQHLWATGALLGPTATTHWVDHTSNRTLVLRNMQLAGGNRGFQSRSGSGDVFALDVFASFDVTDGRLYAWQLNTELPIPTVTPKPPMVFNFARNSIVRLVGFKTEQDGTSLSMTGGMSEFLGCHLMPGVGTGAPHPVQPTFIVQDGQLAASYKIFSDNPAEVPPLQLVHTKAGEMRTVDSTAMSVNVGDVKTNAFAPLLVAR